MRGRGTSPFFYKPTGGSGPTSLLQSWYDSLSVKPSAGLWSDLNTLADGMNADGDWGEIDFIDVSGGMEVEEQAMRPLKTTGGAVLTREGGNDVSWTSDGFKDSTGNTSSAISSNFTPSIHAVKFQLNSAFFGTYARVDPNNDFLNTYGLEDSNRTVYNDINGFDTYADGNIKIFNSNATASKSDFASGVQSIFVSGKKTASVIESRINNESGTGVVAVGLMPIYPVYVYGDNLNGNTPQGCGGSVVRASIIGSSLIDHDRVASRLNTFFAARGLSISNY